MKGSPALKEERRASALSYLIDNLFEARSLDMCLDIAIKGLSMLDFFQSQISLLENGNFVVKRNHMDKNNQFLLEKISGRKFLGHVLNTETNFIPYLLNSKIVSTIEFKGGVRVKLEDVIRGYLPTSNRSSLLKKVTSVIPKEINLLMVPLSYKEEVIGAVGFSDTSIQREDVMFLENLCKMLTQAFEKVQLNNALKESEEKYRNIFEKASDAMIYLDKSGKILDVNRKALEVFSGLKEEIVGKHFTELDVFHPNDLPRLVNAFGKGLMGDEVTISICIKNKNGRDIFLECFGSLMKTDDDVVGSMVIARDITQRRQMEEEMKRQLMRFKLEDGNLYLVAESIPALSLEAFKDLLKIGYHGHVITRTPREEFLKAVAGDYQFYWLAERGRDEFIPPMIEKIEIFLKELPRRSAVYIDRLDYLISKNGFKETLFFVQSLRELAYLARNILILSIDPATFLDKRELRLLEKETKKIEPRFLARLPENMLEILRFVFEKNNLGTKPNHTAVRNEVGKSKPTVGKNIKRLIASGYLVDSPSGSSKVLELTPRGRSLFT